MLATQRSKQRRLHLRIKFKEKTPGETKSVNMFCSTYPGPLLYLRSRRRFSGFPANLWTWFLQNLRDPRGPCPIRAKHSLWSRPRTSSWTNSSAAWRGLTGGAPQLIDRRRWWVVCKSDILHVCCLFSLSRNPSVRDLTVHGLGLKSGMMVM